MSAEKLRGEIAKLEVRRGQRYPGELKARVIAWTKSERSRNGTSFVKLSAALGMHTETLRCWCAEPRRKPMRRVVVEEGRTGVVVIVTPSGFRAELELRDAMTLLATLG